MREVIGYNGAGIISSVGGQIRLQEAAGRLVIYDPETQRERVVHDVTGSHYNDNLGREMTRVDTLGLTTMEPAGRFRNRVGIAGDDGRTGIWTSKPSVDLRDEIGG